MHAVNEYAYIYVYTPAALDDGIDSHVFLRGSHKGLDEFFLL